MSRVRTLCAGRPAVVGARSRSPEDLGRRRIELKVWRRTERGLQMEEESVVFSNIKVRVKRDVPSGLVDLEAGRSRLGENGVSVHLAAPEASFMPD